MKTFKISAVLLLAQFLLVTMAQAGAPATTVNTDTIIRCNTNNNGGNFSVFIGTLTESGLVGTLTRGMNTGSAGAANTSFEISARGVPSDVNTLLNFELNEDLRMPPPFNDVGWSNPKFTVMKTLLFAHRRGGMVEKGVAYQGTIQNDYSLNYICVATTVSH